MVSKSNLASRISALEVASGAKNRVDLGSLKYDQPTMSFMFQSDLSRRLGDHVFDPVALIKLFKDNPCLFVLAEPSGDSYDRGYGGFVWVVGDAFKDSKYASVEEFVEYLQRPPDPLYVERGKRLRDD